MFQSTLPGVLEAVHMPENAQISALALLGAAAAFAVSFLAAAITAAAGQTKTATTIAALAAAILVTYGGVLLGLAVTSPDRVLAAGGRKYFCELDCHLATSLERVETAKSVGPSSARLSAAGRFVVVRVRTWFDPSTIAPWRGDAALTPNPRTAWIVDASGRRYPVSAEATRAAAGAGMPSEGLQRALRPGESSETTLVFDLPADATKPKLFVGDEPGVERIVLGHENSPFHGKVLFDLPI
jgi:hypothetical protein